MGDGAFEFNHFNHKHKKTPALSLCHVIPKRISTKKLTHNDAENAPPKIQKKNTKHRSPKAVLLCS